MSGGTLSLDGLREAVAVALGAEPATIADDDDLLHLGLDSVRMMALASRWRQTGLELKFSELAARPTLAAWWELAAAQLRNGNGATANGSAAPPPVVDESAPFELAPMQHAYWVGRGSGQTLGGVGAHFYAEFDDVGIEPEGLEQAVRALIARHGMLRARFLDDGRQQILPESPWPGLTVHDLRQLPDPEAAARLGALRERLSHRKLDVERGEVFDVQLTLLAGGETRIHVQIEMLVADALSFRILLAELAQLYDRPGEELPPLGYSFPRYLAERSARRAAVLVTDVASGDQRLVREGGIDADPLADIRNLRRIASVWIAGNRVAR
jgi:aryl carrier-like protein